MQAYLLIAVTDTGNLFVDGNVVDDKLRALGLLGCAVDHINLRHLRRAEAQKKKTEAQVKLPAQQEQAEPGNS